MDHADRRREIVERIRRDGRVAVAELALRLETSEVTVRRDLDVLAQSGVLLRIRGGAVSQLKRGEELPFSMREIDGADAKVRIADMAASLVRDGEAIVVDSGTTGLAVARALAGRRLTVMPLSLQAATVLSGEASISLLLPGGSTRFGEGSLVGPLTEANIASLRFDTVVLTCCGVSVSGGVTAHDLADAAVKRAAVKAASRTVLVVEGAKFARTALALVCQLDEIDVVITDRAAPGDAVSALEGMGIEVHIV
jgi:DeoR/GlpR family transcriptional regulator of sugar metabolism